MKIPVRKVLSGSALKWIAIVTMFIDHIGASLLEVFVLAYQTENWEFWYHVDKVLRLVGRISFPIFCFLLVEGALHTRNLNKYLGRMAVFALISEVPFDLAFHNSPVYWESQNVFFTLFLGLCAIWIFVNWKREIWRGLVGLVFLAVVAQLCHTDYGAVGVLVIILMYVLREEPWLRFLICAGVLIFFSYIEWPVIFSFLLIALYNGERGYQPKYFFYVFYPAHLLVLWAAGYFFLPILS
jgi:hypothetical protein